MNTFRRFSKGVVAVVIAVGALLTGTGVAQAALSPSELEKVTDNYLFQISLEQFQSVRVQQPYSDQLDWSNDGCSYSPDEPFGYDFIKACYRHDFGYRNYKAQSRFTEDSRLRIDDNFHNDMYTICDGDGFCEATADVYYWAVREFGASSTSSSDSVQKAHVKPVKSADGSVVEYEAVDHTGNTVKFKATKD